MKYVLAGIVLLWMAVFVSNADACVSGFGAKNYADHKSLHFAGSAAATMAATYVFDDPDYGAAAGIAVGAARELQKMNTGGSCEVASILADLAGVALGDYLAKEWMIATYQSGFEVIWTKPF